MEHKQNRKRLYNVPVTWSVSGSYEVEAWSKEDAIRKAEDRQEFPTYSDYVDGSFHVEEAWVEEIPRNVVTPKEVSEKIADLVKALGGADIVEKASEPTPTKEGLKYPFNSNEEAAKDASI